MIWLLNLPEELARLGQYVVNEHYAVQYGIDPEQLFPGVTGHAVVVLTIPHGAEVRHDRQLEGFAVRANWSEPFREWGRRQEDYLTWGWAASAVTLIHPPVFGTEKEGKINA